MKTLFIILIIVFLFSLILSLLSMDSKMTAMHLVKDMGIGYNFANTFECYSQFVEIKTPEEQITLWGNVVPTKKMIKNLKKYGFKTVRLPITWINFIDNMGNIDSSWILYIKEVVNWVVKDYSMYCIINIHNDCKDGNWLSKGISAKNIFIQLWNQISQEFINYDEHLLFESMDNPFYYNSDYSYNFDTLLIFNQEFINTVRNTGGNNRYRLLLISGGDSQIDLVSSNLKIPIDPYNKFAITINYFYPSNFCVGNADKWGSENDYKNMFTDFGTLKTSFIDKGIPVVITGVSVLTNTNKEQKSIREYLYFLFSLSLSLDGMISCIWDTSTSEFNYYDRVNDKWFDEEIKKNFKKVLSKGKYIKPTDFSYVSNTDTVTTINSDGNMRIEIGSRKTKRVIFNVILTAKYSSEVGFGVCGLNAKGDWMGFGVSGDKGKKQYDGSYTYNIDISNNGFNSYIEVQIWWGDEYIIFNSFSVEYEQSYTFFNFSSYKNELSNN